MTARHHLAAALGQPAELLGAIERGVAYGAERSARRAAARLALDTLLASLTVLPYDEPAAHRLGALKAALEQRGERIVDADQQIAATSPGDL